MPTPVFLVALVVLGLAFGSFANVVIWRFPRRESLSSPPSRCPNCDAPISWHDNIPLVSWLVLRGRCRACGSRISRRYPLVELLSALLWLLAGLSFGSSLQTVFAIAFFYLLLVLSFIDLDTMRLPNPLVGLLGLLGMIGSLVAHLTTIAAVPLLDYGGWLSTPLVASVVGAIVSAGVSLGIAMAYSAVRKADGFGMGDVKLLGVIGVFLGPYGLMTLFVGSVAGALVGIVLAVKSRGSLTARYPFGPFLALSAVVVAIWGPAMWSWYLGLSGLR